MNRKEFLRRACKVGIACGGSMFLQGRELPARQSQPAQNPNRADLESKFKEQWVVTLMENMEKNLDQSVRLNLMGQCGRACARRGGLFATAQSCRGDVAKFVQLAGGRISKDLCYIEGDVIHWGYPRCFCELVAAGPARLPESYCYCSIGWVEEMFETVSGKPVRVELLQSVKRGARDCRFLVRIGRTD